MLGAPSASPSAALLFSGLARSWVGCHGAARPLWGLTSLPEQGLHGAGLSLRSASPDMALKLTRRSAPEAAGPLG